MHVDYAGPLLGRQFLILVDSHSKWIEVKPVTNPTSAATIEHLRSIFATHGLPEMLVSDNGSVFTSSEFENFTKRNGIRHVRSAPYHPASNGLAERAVQTFKAFIKKETNGTIDTRVSHFLSLYRTTPHSTTGIVPAVMLLGRRPRTRLDLLIPDMSGKVQQRQQAQKTNHDKTTKERTFQTGDSVSVCSFPGDTWVQGTIEKPSGPLSYYVKLQDGRLIRRHIDHILARAATPPEVSQPSEDWTELPDVAQESSTTTSQQVIPALRRSSRPSMPPKRFGQSAT